MFIATAKLEDAVAEIAEQVRGSEATDRGASGDDRDSCASLHVLALRSELERGLRTKGRFALGDYAVEVAEGGDSLWALVRRTGRGGVALRCAYAPGGFVRARRVRSAGATLRIEAESALGEHVVTFDGSGVDLHRLCMRSTLRPARPLLLPYVPRDLYMLDGDDDPLGSHGRVEAAQRGPNTGLIYATLDEPAFGHLLYVQNLTALNDYCRATGTDQTSIVGGEWPELGCRLPTALQDGDGALRPLPPGEPIVLSDVILVLRDLRAGSEQERAAQFLQMLGVAYPALEPPAVCYRDWVRRAERTLRDLDTAPEAMVSAYGHRYVRPYTDAEYPDSMVQMTLTASIHEYARWTGKPIPLEQELAAGMGKFYDAELGTIRRYLPNVGEDKDAEAVDAWYLYHPLRNLAQMALDGEDWARDLFLQSIEFGIRAAHHFDYVWPIQYDIRDFSVITATRGDEEHGQTDVGGFYAYVMLLAHELTGEVRFLDEARAEIDVAAGMRFELEYQANLTAWGAAACMRLWRITNADRYRDQAYVYLASFFHNCEIWESQVGTAEHFSTYLGATCLHDAPYMAMYECFDSFAGLQAFLRDSGPDLEPAVRLLVSEYCKYVLHRAWYYYPDALPQEAIATEFRNGHVDRKLSFPVEDLYADGSPAGQVGQEVYGAGAAFVLAARAFHPVEDASFRLFSTHVLHGQERTGERSISVQLIGGEGCVALLAVVRKGRAALPDCKLVTAGGDTIRAAAVEADRIEFHVPADGRVILSWS